MIAIRGKIDGTQWKGHWSFVHDPTVQLPFAYEWREAVEASTVPIPSSVDDDEDEEEPSAEKEAPLEADESRGHEEAKEDSEKAKAEASEPPTEESAKETHPVATTPTKPSPDTFAEKGFTDAATKFPICPASGKWTGTFDTAAKPAVPEEFHLFLNATPPSDACPVFAEQPVLTEGHVHVRGAGKNQYGVFELIGSLDPATGIVIGQKMYIRTQSPNSQKRSPSRGRSSSISPRQSQSRKRQMSWKIRDSLDASAVPPEVKRSRRKPRARSESHSHQPLTIQATPSAARPTATPGSTWRLLPAGDPAQARWRSPHYLYYQRLEGDTKYVIYEGAMRQGQRHGRGQCLYHNGYLYKGEWQYNKEHGYGKLSLSGDLVYEGQWERGRMHGEGTYYYKDKSKYVGEFRENMRYGQGQYDLPDGSVYAGQWKDNLMNGRGTMVWPDGQSVYEGEWKDGKRHGLGVLKASDGFVYDGSWVNNAMDGRGSATYPNGQEYHGLFSKGRREGRGTIRFTNGAVYEGRFRDDAVDGQGTMKMSRLMVVPGSGEEKEDFMIPLSFQSDIGHIHRRAGFSMGGE